jgi:hypothetical protein
MERTMASGIDRAAIDCAIDRSLYCAFHGRRHAAREWAAEAVRLMEAQDILLEQYRDKYTAQWDAVDA